MPPKDFFDNLDAELDGDYLRGEAIKIYYLDQASATPLNPHAIPSLLRFGSPDAFANPSAPYSLGRDARLDYLEAKNRIAHYIGAKAHDLIITSGATESNALACSVLSPDGEALLGALEHPSMVVAASEAASRVILPREMRDKDQTITISAPVKRIKTIKAKKSGLLDLEDLRAKITDKTELISVSLADGELGIIQPLSKIAEIIREERKRRLENHNLRPLYFHTDASQALTHYQFTVSRLGVDMMTMGSAKIGGPHGVGVLYHSPRTKLTPLIPGGGQENGFRGGTENLAGVAGFLSAMNSGYKDFKENQRLDAQIVQDLRTGLQKSVIPPLFLGDKKHQLPNFCPVSFPGVDAERLIFILEKYNVFVSTGAACAASKGEKSAALKAIGLSDAEIQGSLRLSVGPMLDPEDASQAAWLICRAVEEEARRIGLKGAKNA